MKKIYLSFAAMLFAGSIFGQSSQNMTTVEGSLQPIQLLEQSSVPATEDVVTPSVAAAAASTPTDTLGWEDFGNLTPGVIEQGGSGYFFGTQRVVGGPSGPYFNAELAAGFISNNPNKVIGAMIFFVSKADVSGDPADLNVKAYNLAENRAQGTSTSTSLDAIGPNSVLTSVALPFADIDTPSTVWVPTFVTFPNEPWVSGDFAIAVEFAGLYGGAAVDTITLSVDENGDSDGDYTWTGLSFEAAPGSLQWVRSTIAFQGGYDVHLAIFAIVAESLTSIEEQGFVNGVKMTTYPNPAVSSDVVRIQYGLENASDKVEVNVYDMNGKLMFSHVEGDKVAGIHTLDIPAGTLSAGSYIYSLEANGGRMAKRMEIVK